MYIMADLIEENKRLRDFYDRVLKAAEESDTNQNFAWEVTNAITDYIHKKGTSKA